MNLSQNLFPDHPLSYFQKLLLKTWLELISHLLQDSVVSSFFTDSSPAEPAPWGVTCVVYRVLHLEGPLRGPALWSRGEDPTLPLQGAQVRSLVGERRSHMHMAKQRVGKKKGCLLGLKLCNNVEQHASHFIFYWVLLLNYVGILLQLLQTEFILLFVLILFLYLSELSYQVTLQLDYHLLSQTVVVDALGTQFSFTSQLTHLLHAVSPSLLQRIVVLQRCRRPSALR